jgi:hypothetical protein
MRGLLTLLVLLALSPIPAFAGTAALEEVNAARAARGLRPFVEDPSLTEAADAAAAYRADRFIAGHTGNDFAFLPNGAQATASGCAAWPDHFGWGSCCTYENWTYAGAGWVRGRDGRRYMHLFVR